MSGPRERPLTRWERRETWWGLVGVGVAGVATVVVASGLEADVLRGHSPWGLVAGVATTLGVLVVGLYAWLKRRAPRGGLTALGWFQVHTVLGLGLLVVAAAHAGWSLLVPRPTTGWALLGVLVLLAASGLGWRGSQRRAGRRLGKALQGTDKSARSADLMAAERPALHGGRLWHVPLTLAVLVLLPLHVVASLDGLAWLAPRRLGHPSAEACADCHETIVEQWRGSMHAHAMSSPVMVAQNNAFVTANAGSRHVDVCVNCHGPVGVKVTDGLSLPFEAQATVSDPMGGVDCVTCHQLDFDRTPPADGLTLWADGELEHSDHALSGYAALDGFQALLRPGRLFWGTVARPAGNSHHRSRYAPALDDDGELCAACHNVHLRPDGGHTLKGRDLVLQTLVQEWQVYRSDEKYRAGADEARGCVDCHMVAPDRTPVLDGPAVDRRGHVDADGYRTTAAHTFVGVDYPLGAAGADATHRAAREALLRTVAQVRVADGWWDGADVIVEVRVKNVGSGHAFPSGFAFARQVWLELRVLDSERQEVLYQSGVLAGDDADLCDSNTLEDPIGAFVQGCQAGADSQLVNLQGRLMNRVRAVEGKVDWVGNPVLEAAPGAGEVSVQTLTAGAVARERWDPVRRERQALTPLAPQEEAVYRYRVPGVPAAGGEVEVRLRFRNLPPYFLRAMAEEPGAGDEVGRLVPNLQVVDMLAEPMRARIPPSPRRVVQVNRPPEY